MSAIETLVPAPRLVDIGALREFAADPLAQYVIDPEHPWWRRIPCAEALVGRVPEKYVADLIGRVTDPSDASEVRIALLDVLADRAELLPWLQREARQDEGYGVPAESLKTRGRLGDRTAIPELATLAFDPWSHQRNVGQAGLDALVEWYGGEAILAELDGALPEHRAARLRIRHHAGVDVVDALADPDRAVAYLAQNLVTDPERLRRYLDETPTVEATLWAAYALHRLTDDTAETRAIYDALGQPRVEIPGLDEELRAAIVREYAPVCERYSDPRWRVEALCAEPAPPVDQDEQLRRAMDALTAAGLVPKSPVRCGDDWGSGDGTYHVIRYGNHALEVSTLGPFAMGDDADPTARQAIESAGFRWIDQILGSIRVTDLCVYFFGARDPLCVGDLLFYWQD